MVESVVGVLDDGKRMDGLAGSSDVEGGTGEGKGPCMVCAGLTSRAYC